MLAFVLSLLATTVTPVVSNPQEDNLVAIREPESLVTPEPKPEPNLEHLANLIGAVESDTAGGYNAANAGSPYDLGHNGLIKITGRTCDQVTIGEIKAWQRRGLLYAVGRYQIIPRTFRAAVQWAGLKDSDYFTPANQDKLFRALLQHKRPSVWAYIKHGASINVAVMELAREWAGLPTLRGVSYYGGGNRSHATVPQVVAALEAARAW